MAHENIRSPKSNFAIVNGYFYTLNESRNALICKVDDGDVAFEYPTDATVGTAIKALQHDGYYFWSMQAHPSNGLLFKKWLIRNSICTLITTFDYINDTNFTYDSDAFGLECYNTYITSISANRTDNLSIHEYYDNVVVSGTKLALGPNTDGNQEIVTVSGVVSERVYLTDNTTYKYQADDIVTTCRSFFVFNDYSGTSAAKGSLMRFDADTGAYMSSTADVEYQNVAASTFYRFQNILPDYPSAHSLIYVKGTNAKLRNMSDLVDLLDATTLNDYFDGADYTSPDTTLWSIELGDPYLFNNTLFAAVIPGTTDETKSNYELINDFEVQVSGTLTYSPTLSGTNLFEHYMQFTFPHSTSDEYRFGMIHSAETLNFYTSIDGVVDNIQPVTSGTSYLLKVERLGIDLDCYYKEITASGIVDSTWSLLVSLTSFTSDCRISLGAQAHSATISGSAFDNLEYTYGSAVYPLDDIPFYGVMNMDNVRADQVTNIAVYDLSVNNNSLYRLQAEGTYYGSNNSWSTYNYQTSPIRPFIDFITLGADPVILPANGRNVSVITAVVQDQYGNGAVNRPVVFTDDNDTGYITTPLVNTDPEYGTGKSVTVYKTGLDVTPVIIEGTVTQYD